MFVKETHLNSTKGYCLGGDEDFYEPYTEDTGKLFKSYQKEFGRCISKVYVDVEGEPKAIGWVFSKKREYDNSEETYEHEVWVELATEVKVIPKQVEVTSFFLKEK